MTGIFGYFATERSGSNPPISNLAQSEVKVYNKSLFFDLFKRGFTDMSDRLFNENDGIDEDNCLQMYDNSYDFYKLVLGTFTKEIAKTVVSLKETFAAKDKENYRILVHGLKGSGASAGAGHLVEMATESNALLKEDKWEEAERFHEPIIAELERLLKLIPERIG